MGSLCKKRLEKNDEKRTGSRETSIEFLCRDDRYSTYIYLNFLHRASDRFVCDLFCWSGVSLHVSLVGMCDAERCVRPWMCARKRKYTSYVTRVEARVCA